MGVRRNLVLGGQAGIGAVVAVFAGSTFVAPFSTASQLLGVALTTMVVVAGLALIFELIMLPFGASSLGVRVHRALWSWVALGILGSLGVVSGVLGHGIPGDVMIVFMRVGTFAALVVSALYALRSKRSE